MSDCAGHGQYLSVLVDARVDPPAGSVTCQACGQPMEGYSATFRDGQFVVVSPMKTADETFSVTIETDDEE